MGIIQIKSLKTKDGKEYLIRNLRESDAEPLLEFAKNHSFDLRFSVITVDEFKMTVEEEIKWIQSYLTNDNNLGIVAEAEGSIIGLLNFSGKKPSRMEHIGSFGITVHTDFREMGVGTELLKSLIEWARMSPKIEKIILGVLATNARAVALYKKLGFEEEGYSRKALKNLDGTYVDDLTMALWVK